MLDIDEITKMPNVMQPEIDRINNYQHKIFYGLGSDLQLEWNNYVDYFGKPDFIVDRSGRNGSIYDGVEILNNIDLLPPPLKQSEDVVIIITAPSAREAIYKECLRWFNEEDIVKYPSLIVMNPKNYSFFIKENKNEINGFYSSLADNESRDVLESWIKGRVSNDISYFCSMCIPNNYVNEQLLPLEFLQSKGYDSDLIFNPEEGRQVPCEKYYNTGLYVLRDDEVLYDCGAAHGDTFDGFKEAVGDRFKGAVLFEMERHCYEDLKESVKNDLRVHCMCCGVADENKTISINGGSSLGGVSLDNLASDAVDTDTVELRTIDSIVEETGIIPTFIKMDIEGAEIGALRGAGNTIRRYSPNLGICVYHKNEDIIDIPSLIRSFNPNYNMYLRHFDCSPSELILFCIRK